MAVGGNIWQPIETAPRDGTTVLLYFPDAGKSQIDVGYWIEWEVGDANWSNEWTDAEIDCDPSHWMPLPEPPEAA
jgi:hypothetical protein